MNGFATFAHELSHLTGAANMRGFAQNFRELFGGGIKD